MMMWSGSRSGLGAGCACGAWSTAGSTIRPVKIASARAVVKWSASTQAGVPVIVGFGAFAAHFGAVITGSVRIRPDLAAFRTEPLIMAVGFG